MQCEDAQELLAARIAVEIDDVQHQQLARHLAECAHCRSVELQWQQDDRRLNREFSQKKAAADRVAKSVIEQLKLSSETETSADSIRIRQTDSQPKNVNWLTAVLATAVAVLFFLVVVRSRPEHPQMTNAVETGSDHDSRGSNAPEPAVPTSLANLVALTSPIEVRQPDSGEWSDVTDSAAFQCVPRTEIRTGPESICEIVTEDDCLLRMNSNTRLVMDSGRRVIIQKGQLWCRSASKASLEVVAETEQPDAELQATNLIYRCPSGSSCLMNVDSADLQIHAAEGKGTLTTPDGDHELEAGQQISVFPDGTLQPRYGGNPLIAAGWMDVLLIQRNPDDPDLKLRVDALLAEMGRTKASFLYERELRSLGEHCVLPLTRFVQSEISHRTPTRRLTAMRVVSDIAPAWNIENLISLLDDREAQVRVLAARALQRLTGESHGRSPEGWRAAPPKDDAVRQKWAQWWRKHRKQNPQIKSEW